MKKIKTLIITAVGALILGIAAVPAGAQTWDRSRTVIPSNGYDRYNNSRDQYNRDRFNRGRERSRNQFGNGWDNYGSQNRDWNTDSRNDRHRYDRRWQRQNQGFGDRFGLDNHH